MRFVRGVGEIQHVGWNTEIQRGGFSYVQFNALECFQFVHRPHQRSHAVAQINLNHFAACSRTAIGYLNLYGNFAVFDDDWLLI